MGADALAVAVDIEFDSGRWDHASETGSQPSEESSPAFGAIDIAYYSGGLVACVESTVGHGGGGGRRMLVEVGLETCSEDIEGRCDDCRGEAAAPGM